MVCLICITLDEGTVASQFSLKKLQYLQTILYLYRLHRIAPLWLGSSINLHCLAMRYKMRYNEVAERYKNTKYRIQSYERYHICTKSSHLFPYLTAVLWPQTAGLWLEVLQTIAFPWLSVLCLSLWPQLQQVSQVRRLEDRGTTRRAPRHTDTLDIADEDLAIGIVSQIRTGEKKTDAVKEWQCD